MANDPKPQKKDPKKENQRPKTTADEIVAISRSRQEGEFNFAEYKKAILADPRARKVVEDFLKYRHREWEENIASGPDPGERE